MKYQLKLIKNRESALLSRKKRKEYLTSLEIKVGKLSSENEALRNVSLLFQLQCNICRICLGFTYYITKSSQENVIGMRNFCLQVTRLPLKMLSLGLKLIIKIFQRHVAWTEALDQWSATKFHGGGYPGRMG